MGALSCGAVLAQNTKLSITHSFFLSYRVQILHASSYGQSEQNTKVQKVQKSTKSTKVLITQPFFELQTPDFARKFIWTVQPNDKVEKVQKVQKVHKYKNTKQKSTKIQKMQ